MLLFSPVMRRLSRIPTQVWLFTVLGLAALLAACGGDGGSHGAGDSGAGASDASGGGGAAADAAAPRDRFVFCSARTGRFEIYRYEDGQITQLTDDASQDAWWPRISPDRTRVAFYRSAVTDRPAQGGWDNDYQHATLWLMNADGTGAHPLLTLADQGWSAQGVANWSPDGSRLVMTAQDQTTHRWSLYLLDLEQGGPPARVSTRDSFYLDPSWSPDGQRLVFSAFPPDATGTDLAQLEIYTARADGSDEVRLTDDDVRDHDPSWSPDGSTVVFESEMDPAALRWALRTVTVDGHLVGPLLDDGNINTLGRYRPDGALTFHRFVLNAGTSWRISRIEPDGTGLADLTHGADEDVNADPY